MTPLQGQNAHTVGGAESIAAPRLVANGPGGLPPIAAGRHADPDAGLRQGRDDAKSDARRGTRSAVRDESAFMEQLSKDARKQSRAPAGETPDDAPPALSLQPSPLETFPLGVAGDHVAARAEMWEVEARMRLMRQAADGYEQARRLL